MPSIAQNETETKKPRRLKRPHDFDGEELPDHGRDNHHSRSNSPNKKSRLSKNGSSDQQSKRRMEGQELSPDVAAVGRKKTKRERKNNPSSRIHSLRKLLNRAEDMPMTIRQEKERELAALLADQSKKAASQASKKNLQKYHFVRFIERQKAERTLRKLEQQERESSTNSNPAAKAKLAQRIHEIEVDVNYTKYAPLGEKYISLYADESQTPKGKQKVLSEDEARDEPGKSTTQKKPPMWYTVEKFMLDGQSKLEALREGILGNAGRMDKELIVSGGKEDSRHDSKSSNTRRAPTPRSTKGKNEGTEVREEAEDSPSDGDFFE